MAEPFDPEELERAPDLTSEQHARINNSAEAMRMVERLNSGVERYRKSLEATRVPVLPDPAEERERAQALLEQQRTERREAIERERQAIDLTAELVELQRHLIGRQDVQARKAEILFWLEVFVAAVVLVTLVVSVVAL